MAKRDFLYYESMAEKLQGVASSLPNFDSFPQSIHYSPYIYFETHFGNLINESHKVLEVGAGIGNLTGYLLRKTKQVTVLDYSPQSIAILKKRFPMVRESVVANIENMPIADSSFDFVFCSAVLAYGDSEKIDREIARVLKPGGFIIVIDSLRSNPIYFLYRLRYFVMRKRSFQAIVNLPHKSRIDSWERNYEKVHLQFFGVFAWLNFILGFFWDSAKTLQFIGKFDRYKLISNYIHPYSDF